MSVVKAIFEQFGLEKCGDEHDIVEANTVSKQFVERKKIWNGSKRIGTKYHLALEISQIRRNESDLYEWANNASAVDENVSHTINYID